jgi:hypothetical protein
VPSTVFRGSDEFKDFRCHRSVTLSHSTCHSVSHLFHFQIGIFVGFLYFLNFLCHSVTLFHKKSFVFTQICLLNNIETKVRSNTENDGI